MDPGVRCHGMKANPTGYLWSKYECFLMSGCQDIDFKKTLTKWNGNGNAYDRGGYNSSFALRAVELKIYYTVILKISIIFKHSKHLLWSLQNLRTEILPMLHNTNNERS